MRAFEFTEMMDEDFDTENCIICLNPATNYCGHVLLGPIAITAGFCGKHTDTNIPSLANMQGCYGGWLPEYGLKKGGK